MLELAGKRIVVTGASAGIGRGTAQLLSQLGAQLVLLGRNAQRLQDTLDSLSGSGHSVSVFDLEASNEIPPLLAGLAKDGGRLWGIFHAAGTLSLLPVRAIKEPDFDRIVASSLKAALFLAKGFVQRGVYGEEGGSLVLMSSVAGRCGQSAMSIYSASKAGIEGLTRSLACELAPRRIRVNSIAAGAVQTDMHASLANMLSEESLVAYERRHLLGFGETQDVANAAAFLLSDAASWITGTTMVVDGGYSCH